MTSRVAFHNAIHSTIAITCIAVIAILIGIFTHIGESTSDASPCYANTNDAPAAGHLHGTTEAASLPTLVAATGMPAMTAR